MPPLRLLSISLFLLAVSIGRAGPMPTLPEKDGTMNIDAQEWPLKPGPRSIKVYIYYPGGNRNNVNAKTGLMKQAPTSSRLGKVSLSPGSRRSKWSRNSSKWTISSGC
jgi:hypothetical protein